jgi:hypothetical protein
MAAEATIRFATYADGWALAARLRQADADEVRASTGQEPLPAILDSIEASVECCALFIGGELAAIWGVVPVDILAGVGHAWMLTTDVVERRARAFWVACRNILASLLDRWAMLENAIDARHEKAVRWARRLGFRLAPAVPFGHAGMPFHFFRVTKGDLTWAPLS